MSKDTSISFSLLCQNGQENNFGSWIERFQPMVTYFVTSGPVWSDTELDGEEFMVAQIFPVCGGQEAEHREKHR